MTLEQRRAARERVDSFLGGLYVSRAELAGYLVDALAQLDADEALMRNMLKVLEDVGGACLFPECEEVYCVAARALRARLGDPAPEPEKSHDACD